jgi:hypothetical protein
MAVTMPVSWDKSAIAERKCEGRIQVFQVPPLGQRSGTMNSAELRSQQDGADLSLAPEGGLQLSALANGAKLMIRSGGR